MLHNDLCSRLRDFKTFLNTATWTPPNSCCRGYHHHYHEYCHRKREVGRMAASLRLRCVCIEDLSWTRLSNRPWASCVFWGGSNGDRRPTANCPFSDLRALRDPVRGFPERGWRNDRLQPFKSTSLQEMQLLPCRVF